MLAFTSPFPELSSRYDWIAIRHQSGGLTCDQVYLVGIRLRLKPGLAAGFREIARARHGANGGRFHHDALALSDIIEYAGALKLFELDCETSFRLLQEGVYPVDATQANMDLVFCDAPDRSDILDGFGFGNLTILILAENSD